MVATVVSVVDEVFKTIFEACVVVTFVDIIEGTVVAILIIVKKIKYYMEFMRVKMIFFNFTLTKL